MKGKRIFGFRCYRVTDALKSRCGYHSQSRAYRMLERTLAVGWQQLRRR